MRTKRVLNRAVALATAAAAGLMPFGMSLVNNVRAASLTDVSVALTNEAVSSTDNVVITFTPNTAITNGTILEVSYDTGITGGASLTDGDVDVTGTNITSSAESGFVDGYFRSTLTTTGSVTTTVTITIDGANELTTPATSGNYNFSVIADIGGAGTTYDSGAGLAYVADDNDITVTAVVPPVIDMELYQTGTDTELTDPNTCALGVLSLNTVSSCDYDIGFGTNNTAGLTIQVTSDGDLDSGADTIDACTGTNCDGLGAAGVDAGQEEYGFRVSDTGAGCSASAAGSYGTADQAVPTTATNFVTTTATCAGTTLGNSAQHVEVTHSASMATDTVVGSYNQEVTYTAFTN
ncbi:hypothetical protein KC717_03265 [Candidatus Dojkabacteria bacterium]|uniref:Uncharacterized protein n=1 Tax=Candidatus Dojkabacteria bacterium TaxID=2099670 RepID=A0A955L8I2_9BACT|nr:hypothetical protein [Candidatus Dojkabacteria bacterium]